jgi:ketosteroid isomerase-like protein
VSSIDIDIIQALIRTRLLSALEQMSGGAPSAYAALFADGATFTDPATREDVQGVAAIAAHLAIRPVIGGRFNMVDARFEFSGLTALMRFDVQTSTEAGNDSRHLSATHVYGFAAGEWRIMHAHWIRS